ncbi:MAG: Fe-S cluster assembly protein SufD [Hydrogenovibrio sp.]
MTVAVSPKMSPAARQMLDHLVAQARQLNENTQAEALVEKRLEAESRLLVKGLPTRQDEDWQYTSLLPWLPHRFEIKASGAEPSLEALQTHLLPEEAIRLVFVDGVFSESLSAGFDLIPDALSIEMAEADAIQTISPKVEADAFELMNELLLDQGLTVRLDDRAALDVPVYVVQVQTQSEGLTNLRMQVEVGEKAEMTLIQQYVCLGGVESVFVNELAHLHLGQHARLKQVVLQDLSRNSFYFNHQYFRQAEASDLSTVYLGLGAEISRHQNQVALAGSYAECEQNSIGFGTDKQLVDSRTETLHQVAHCNSRQLHKFVLDGQARGVFNGMIYVAQDAQKTDGQMDNKNLLLSNDANMDTKPQLEIYADDVKCSHGCASGEIDENQLFYAQARGIRKADAVRLITQAFLLEPLETLSKIERRQWLASQVMRKLDRVMD